MLRASAKLAAAAAVTVGVEIAILVYNTPRLPEAAGKRTGTCVDKEHVKEVKKKPGDLSILVFGDSVATGVGCDSNKVAFAGCIAKEMSSKVNNTLVHWKILGKSGFTAKDCETKLIPILERKKRQKNVGRHIFDVCVVSIGVNHVLSLHSPATFEEELTSMLTKLSEALTVTSQHGNVQKKCVIIVAAMPPMEKFPQISYLWPLNILVGYYASLMTAVTKKVCAANSKALGTVCVEFSDIGVDTSSENIKQLMAPDGFHPAQGACEIMAKQIVDVYKNLDPNKEAT